MSFNTEFKGEILAKEFTTNAERFAFISAVLRVCGTIHIDNRGANIEVENEYFNLISKFVNEVKVIYDISVEIDVQRKTNISDKSYKVKLPKEYTERIGDDTGFITYIGGQAVGFSAGAYNEFDNKNELKAYLLGIVASCISVTVPVSVDTTDSENEIIEEIYSGGYHLEMQFYSETLAYDIMNYLAQFDIFVKKIDRGEQFGLYIKDSNMISDFMAFFGASQSVLEINNILVSRSVRNDTNRVRNCELANMDKSILASVKQIQAIKLIDLEIGLDNLPDKLREVALLRVSNPDHTLDELRELLGGDISKSGINHRFRKLMEIARNIGDQGESADE